MRLLATSVLLGLGAVSAQAQANQQGGPAPREVTWSVAAGYESFWMRDISGSGTPVDASPVAWTGDGPAVMVESDRWRPGRLHRVAFAYSAASRFVLETPIRTIPRSPSDSATQATGRYEYRRYPFRDVGLKGLALGVGVETSVGGQWVARHFEPSIEVRTSGLDFGVAVVAAAELRRSRVVLEATWANDDKWTSFPQDVAYNASASFLAYLLDTSGPGRMKQLYQVPSSTFPQRFKEIYGRELAEVEREWRVFCASVRA